ncbi:MAG: hypothetical protein WAQ98_18325 [Blastocatellia bacterium]
MSRSTSVAKAWSISSIPNPMVASTKISVSNEAATELAKSVEKAKAYAEGMLAKANDPNAKFFDDNKSVCQSCFGSCFRSIYKNGRRFAKKCEAAKWDETKQKLVCEGNSNWQEIELENKKDLANQIWKIVVSLKQKEYFLFWLQKNYQSQTLSSLMIQQLELVLRKVQNHSIFASLEAGKTEAKQEIATSQISQTSQTQAA